MSDKISNAKTYHRMHFQHHFFSMIRNCMMNYGKTFQETRGGSGISGKGVHIYKGVGVHFAAFISLLKYPMKMK